MKFNTLKIAAVALGMTMAGANGANAESLGIGAGKQGSQNYAVNAGLATFLTNVLGMDVRVQSYGGTGQSLPLINSGRLDLQLVPSPDISAAFAGDETFKGRKLENLRVLGSLSSSAYGFMVRADSPYHKVSDIKGKTITYGYSGQPTLRLQVDGILAAGGLSIDDMKRAMVPSVPNGVDEFISGTADVAFFALHGGKTREADAALGGIRWLAVNDTPAAEAAMKKFVPTSYVKTVEPGPRNVGVKVATPMMGYDYVLTAGTHVPDETVEKIVQAIHDNPEKMRGIASTFAEFDPTAMSPEFDSLVYHPGAAKYFDGIKAGK